MLWILSIWFPVCLYILTPCNLMEVKTSRTPSEVLIIPAFFTSWISLLFPSQLPNIHLCSMCDYLLQLPALPPRGFRSVSENWPSFADLTCNQEVDLVLRHHCILTFPSQPSVVFIYLSSLCISLKKCSGNLFVSMPSHDTNNLSNVFFSSIRPWTHSHFRVFGNLKGVGFWSALFYESNILWVWVWQNSSKNRLPL